MTLSAAFHADIANLVQRLVTENHQRAPFVLVSSADLGATVLRTPHGRVRCHQDTTLAEGTYYVVSKRTWMRMRRDGVTMKAGTLVE